jgi:hypothetical protein
MKSVIASLHKSEIQEDPFPHIVRRNALPSGLFRDLVAEFPDIGHFPGWTDQSNTRLTLDVSAARGSNRVTPLWREFLDVHAGRDHFLSMIDLFAEQIASRYPGTERFIANAKSLNVAVKGGGGEGDAQVLVSSSVDANTPVTREATRVRGPHVDNPTKLLVGLLYLRDEEDSEGGDLMLYRLKRGRKLVDSVLPGCHFRDEAVEFVKTVPYEPNTLFVWMNSPEAIHGVSPRRPTRYPRKLANFFCALRKPVF